jgi:hypothetical protein
MMNLSWQDEEPSDGLLEAAAGPAILAMSMGPIITTYSTVFARPRGWFRCGRFNGFEDIAEVTLTALAGVFNAL